MPTGVLITTSVAPGPNSTTGDADCTYFAVGQAERGPVDEAVLLRSWNDYETYFGSRVTFGSLYDDLKTFFAEAGQYGRAYVARVVDAAATTGTLSLSDRAGAPAPTLRIDAANPGAWSSNVKVEVQDGLIPDTFTLVITYDGDEVETYPNLASPAAAASALSSSAYVRGTDLGSAAAAPNNNPAVAAATALSAGSSTPGNVTSADLITAMNTRFPVELGPGIVAIPGQPHTIATDIAAHCAATRRIGVVAPASGTTVAQAISDAKGLRSTTTNANRVGMTWPWVTIPDGAGGSRTISPEGFTAGVRARTVGTVGPWQAPAGEWGKAVSVTGLQDVPTGADVDALVDSAVNPIKIVQGTPRLYGWRSLSADETNWKFLSYADLQNILEERLNAALEPFHAASIDGRGALFSEVATALVGVLDPVALAGGLYAKTDPDTGAVVDPGYVVDLGSGINTPESIARGEIHAVVGFRPSPVSELIRITLVKAALTAPSF